MEAVVDLMGRAFFTLLLVFVPTMFLLVNKWPYANDAPKWALWLFAAMVGGIVATGFLTVLLGIWVW